MHKLAENYKALSLLHPISIAETNTATGVDVEAYEGDAMVIFDFGTAAGTTETLDAKLQTSIIGDFTDAVDAVTISQLTGTNGDNLLAAAGFSLDPKVKKVRVVHTKSSTGADLVQATLLVRAQKGGATLNSTTPA